MAERAHTALVPRVKETLLGLPPHLLFDDRVVRPRIASRAYTCIHTHIYIPTYTHTYTNKQVTNALAHAFVQVEQEWIAHVESLADPQARVKKVSRFMSLGYLVANIHYYYPPSIQYQSTNTRNSPPSAPAASTSSCCTPRSLSPTRGTAAPSWAGASPRRR